MLSIRTLGAVVLCFLTAAAAARSATTADDLKVPRFSHLFVIVNENKDYAQILNPAVAPHIAGLAKAYGNATEFYGEVHPSEGNYVALVGGDTYGINNDDPYSSPGHTISAAHIGTQLQAAHLSWKGYYESLPAPGSGVITASDPAFDNGTKKTALYASKHSGFMNFASVQRDAQRAQHIVGFEQLERDIASDSLPSFALIVPNQCNDMHGLSGSSALPADCEHTNISGLIGRGDAMVGTLVEKLQATAAWKSQSNVAIVVTFDEGAGDKNQGCCGWEPGSAANFGGGHIPTIVITNHGPRALTDPTPYNHYSLLRTIEDAFGIHTYLGHAAQSDRGVKPMLPLFARKGNQ